MRTGPAALPFTGRSNYGLMGIKNGVNLKLLSLCMGHARTQMTEHYIAEAGLTEQVQAAAWQIAYGQRMVASDLRTRQNTAGKGH
jgi:hypothetical protein